MTLYILMYAHTNCVINSLRILMKFDVTSGEYNFSCRPTTLHLHDVSSVFLFTNSMCMMVIAGWLCTHWKCTSFRGRWIPWNNGSRSQVRTVWEEFHEWKCEFLLFKMLFSFDMTIFVCYMYVHRWLQVIIHLWWMVLETFSFILKLTSNLL